jgi:ribosome-binding factor A
MTNLGKPVTQRQLRVGEMIKQALGMLFIRDEAKLPNLSTKEITVTEVRMSPDLKTAKIFVMPLGGKDTEEVVTKLKEFSFVIRKVLSKKIVMKFLPKLFFVKDDSFDYADKHSSVGLLRAVNRRKKLLDYLKKNKMESYKEVISKLNLRK